MAKFKKGQPRPAGAGRKPGSKNKPKPIALRLSEIFGENISNKDLRDLVNLALTHAKGDTIVTESADGSKKTTKVLSDPRLFIGLVKLVVDAEEGITMPAAPEMTPEQWAAFEAKMKEYEEPLEIMFCLGCKGIHAGASIDCKYGPDIVARASIDQLTGYAYDPNWHPEKRYDTKTGREIMTPQPSA
jgi:hypothetical protein